MKIQAVRIIPFDLGFEINKNILEKIEAIFINTSYTIQSQIFEECILSIRIDNELKMVVFKDGTGEFIFYDSISEFKKLTDNIVNSILHERKKTHDDILMHQHCKSVKINEVLTSIRNVVPKKKRRITSLPSWEHQGLSYVMSFYFIQESYDKLSADNKAQIYKLLYPNNQNKNNKSDVVHFFDKNILLYDNDYFISSWANFIIISDNVFQNAERYVEIQINIQHMWMYTYVTEHLIDHMLLNIGEHNAKIKHINIAYNNLLNMELYIDKYRGIISSIMHDKDHKLYLSLIESSNLNLLTDGAIHKYELLNSRLTWMIDEKRYNSGKRVEIFVFFCTFLGLFSIIKDFKCSYFTDYWYFFICLIGLTYILFFHKKGK